jgi:hypothetical protein
VVCLLVGLAHIQPRRYFHILIIGQIERISFEKGPTLILADAAEPRR